MISYKMDKRGYITVPAEIRRRHNLWTPRSADTIKQVGRVV